MKNKKVYNLTIEDLDDNLIVNLNKHNVFIKLDKKNLTIKEMLKTINMINDFFE